MALALVIAGTFQYRVRAGEAVLYPGSYLLGNPGDCFECGHTHSTGDRCIAIHMSPALFEEVAASVAGSSRYRFAHPMLPARPELTSVATSLQSLATQTALSAEESVFAVVEAAVIALRVRLPSPARLAAADIRRLSAALHHMDKHSALPLRLGQLAAIATMSKYHFLHTFRRVTGSTPHRYLLATRLRRAATAIAQSRQPISVIALNEGFNDLSSFNRYFRRMMNATPGQYRSSFRLSRLS
jgi:AraC family transcriptional regulator